MRVLLAVLATVSIMVVGSLFGVQPSFPEAALLVIATMVGISIQEM